MIARTWKPIMIPVIMLLWMAKCLYLALIYQYYNTLCGFNFYCLI